jgi:hypothetical protein
LRHSTVGAGWPVTMHSSRCSPPLITFSSTAGAQMFGGSVVVGENYCIKKMMTKLQYRINFNFFIIKLVIFPTWHSFTDNHKKNFIKKTLNIFSRCFLLFFFWHVLKIEEL